MNYFIVFSIFGIFIFVLTFVFLKKLIPVLVSKHMGQKILDIGPRWHKSKEGTPTMGGISFIFAGIIAFLIFSIAFFKDIGVRQYLIVLNIMVYGILNGMVGLIDDMAKIRKRKNEGLRPWMKIVFQGVFSIVFLFSMNLTIGINTVLTVPFFNISVDLGVFYYLILFIFLIGIVNSVNLTDGIDGLASSVVSTVGLFLLMFNLLIAGGYHISFIGALLVGSSLGFLTYNYYPARVFMGDTGSLYFGGIIAATVLLTNNIIVALLYCFVFVAESVSDILQVTYFKITKGKRLFKIAPVHHHFERCGWSESKVVSVFTLTNAVFCLVALLGLMI